MPAPGWTPPSTQAPARAVPENLADPRWRTALQEVLREPERLTLHAQPLVELTSGDVAGYEMLSRFHGSIRTSPDQWFAAADHWQVGDQLQARVLAAAVAIRQALPPTTFLTVNIDPHLLALPHVAAALLDHSDLGRLAVEITEHTRPPDEAAFLTVLDQLRDRGAMIAMDDAGTGYAGLTQLLALKPDLVKLDRELIMGVDADPAKRALVEVIGDLVGRMDGWILAEGIETTAELTELVRLGVPLGQGFVLARPAATMATEIPDDMVTLIRSTAARTQLTEHVASLLRPARVAAGPIDADTPADVLLAPDGRPSLVRWGGRELRWSPALVVAPSASLPEVARRAASRAPENVGAPLVCTDGQGVVTGVVTLSDLLIALAASGAGSYRPIPGP